MVRFHGRVHRLVFLTFSIFATPLMKYCDLWLLINIHFALGRVDCALHFGRSRARGVAKTRNVIPMLRGNYVFVWFLCSVGTLFSLFATPLRWECSEISFSEISTWFAHFCLFAVHGRSVMLCFSMPCQQQCFPPCVGIIFSDWDFRFFNTSAVGMREHFLFSTYPIYLLFLIVYCARAALAVTPRLGLMASGSTCLNKTLYLDTPVAWIVPSNCCLVSPCVIIWGGWW